MCVIMEIYEDGTKMLLLFCHTKQFTQLVGHAVRGSLEACAEGVSIIHKE